MSVLTRILRLQPHAPLSQYLSVSVLPHFELVLVFPALNPVDGTSRVLELCVHIRQDIKRLETSQLPSKRWSGILVPCYLGALPISLD